MSRPRSASPRLLPALLGAALLVGGCAAGSSGLSSGPSGTGSPSASATKTVTVSYAGGQVTPPPGRVVVPVGTAVHLVVTSDVADEVHNHYDDVEKEVAAGGTVTFDLVAERPGVYEVELHHADRQLLQLQVQ